MMECAADASAAIDYLSQKTVLCSPG